MKKYLIPIVALVAISPIVYGFVAKEIKSEITAKKTLEEQKELLDLQKIYKFKPAFQSSTDALEQYTSNGSFAKYLQNDDHATDGFYDKTGYRIAYYIQNAQVNAENKHQFDFTGKIKYKNTILPIAGSLLLTDAQALSKNGADKYGYGAAKGKIRFDIQGNNTFGQSFAGDWFGDFAVEKATNEILQSYVPKGITNNNKQLVMGYFTNENKNIQTCFTQNIYAISDNVLKKFIIYGGRDSYINPEYAKRGWTEEYSKWWEDAISQQDKKESSPNKHKKS